MLWIFPNARGLLGPLVPGTVVPHGARVPGTRYELDPSTAAFSLGCIDPVARFQRSVQRANREAIRLIRSRVILMLADHLSRQRQASGRAPLLMREVLDDLIKALRNPGWCRARERPRGRWRRSQSADPRRNDCGARAHARATRDQVVNAVSNAWMDCSPVLYRHAPNTGWRKSWACADASSKRCVSR